MAVLDFNELIAAQTAFERQSLLGQASPYALCADVRAHSAAAGLPPFLLLRRCGGTACGHAPDVTLEGRECLPY